MDIFVFGSNLRGVHGAGAAKTAKDGWGAQTGIGYGPTGHAYAIPTKDADLRVLPLRMIAEYVSEFVGYTQRQPGDFFIVTRVGCGLAGYTDEQIAPLFRGLPDNCLVPMPWCKYLVTT